MCTRVVRRVQLLLLLLRPAGRPAGGSRWLAGRLARAKRAATEPADGTTDREPPARPHPARRTVVVSAHPLARQRPPPIAGTLARTHTFTNERARARAHTHGSLDRLRSPPHTPPHRTVRRPAIHVICHRGKSLQPGRAGTAAPVLPTSVRAPTPRRLQTLRRLATMKKKK